MRIDRLPWKRLFAEGLLIIVSVYVAILLEGRTQDRQDAREAREALVQMLGEMREDRADLADIRTEQRRRDEQYGAVDRWLVDPSSMPPDSAAAYIHDIGWSNRTLFPRRSAWTTMVAAGQLAELDDPALVTRLGNFYESVNERLVYNGELYDGFVNEMAWRMETEVWDGTAERFLTSDPVRREAFRHELRYVHRFWNIWYLELLGQYAAQLESLIDDIEAYLRAHGRDLGKGASSTNARVIRSRRVSSGAFPRPSRKRRAWSRTVSGRGRRGGRRRGRRASGTGSATRIRARHRKRPGLGRRARRPSEVRPELAPGAAFRPASGSPGHGRARAAARPA